MSETGLDRLLSEISEQPAVGARLLDQQHAAVRAVANVVRQRNPTAIVLVARGSSDNAAVYGRYLFEVCNRRLTSLAAPSGLTLYGSGPKLDQTLVVGVSQSGQGEDVVAYVREARAQGAATVAVVNDEGSPLAHTAEWVLRCLAGPELSVPATKTVTAQMLLLAMLSDALADGDGTGLAPLPAALEQALLQREAAASVARQLANGTIGSVIGRGFAFPPALEIALKLKETSYTQAEPFSAADFLHGPVALVEPGYCALLIDCGGRSSEAARDTAAAVRRRGGQPVLLRVAEEAGPDGAGLSLCVPLPEPYAPIAALVLGQLLAIELAVARGLDPAQPRGLRKVTSTR
jgi:glucosamine--fructose-6-phosphate aminotransferase (isomerizing)